MKEEGEGERVVEGVGGERKGEHVLKGRDVGRENDEGDVGRLGKGGRGREGAGETLCGKEGLKETQTAGEMR